MENLSFVNDLFLEKLLTDPQNSHQALQGRSILYIDDEYVNFLYFSELLSGTGAKVLRACSDSQALMSVASDCQICLVIISGSFVRGINYQVVSQLKSIAPHLPVIGIIGSNNNGDAHKFLEVGCDLYLNRHIDNAQLSEIIIELLEDRK